MTTESPDETAARVLEAVAGQWAIDYGSFPDKELPEIQWAVFGLPASNEIAIVASVGAVRVAIAQSSELLFPAMADRILGMDVLDGQLAQHMSEQLWDAQSARLIDEAIKFRSL